MQIGDKVFFIGEAFTGEDGIIESVTDSYYIVKLLSNGIKVKALPQEIEKVAEPTPETITITREDFKKAVAKVVQPCNYTDDINDYGMITAVCLSGELVCKKLARELFGDS